MRSAWWMSAAMAGLVSAGSALALAAAPEPPAAAKEPTAEQTRFFESRIRPVLLEQCGQCHGGELQRGGLRLDSAAAFRKGGGRGPLIAGERPEQSLLLKTVTHAAGVPKMPPGKKLPDRQVADLAEWVKMGAPWPTAQKAVGSGQKAGGHWAFRPVVKPAVPAVKERAWVKNPVDAFILAELERKGLKPAPLADRRTLIRRATFDLTGLPPTPEEVEAFVADRSANAWEKVVERLLASPAYGERWGRHWLDLARYADSNGLDENVHYGNAWRYRDYVIAAFNADKPYDQFLREQIAGDLMPSPDRATRNERLVATGFLAVGPKFISEVDDQKVLMDMIDEQVDTLGRTTMGLTMGCARCHDHKFDPITTKDYYALAGIFKSTKTLEVMKKPRMWWEHPIPTDADQARAEAHAKQVGELKAKIDARVADAKQQLQAGGMTLPANPEPAFPEATRAELKQLRDQLAALEKDAPEPPMAMGLIDTDIVDLPVHVRGDHLNLGEVVPRRFPVILAGTDQSNLEKKQSGRLQLAEWLTSPRHPLTSRVMANRIWRWHFGQGIVRSTDNFGILGEAPSHPALLEWLASTFVEKGWSIKAMHRLLMASNTYQMSSQAASPGKTRAPGPQVIDPENRLHWRSDVRRLEVEAIRDSVLMVSGQLDRAMGGKSLPLKNREYVFDHTSKDATKYDSRRRSIYLPVIRNNLYDVFQLFDFGDASVPEGSRTTTTVAPQALFMMNSDLVLDAAEALAARVLKEPGTDAARIASLYRQAYGRPATPKEIERATALLARLHGEAAGQGVAPEQRPQRAWGWFCHVLLASNEFIYVR